MVPPVIVTVFLLLLWGSDRGIFGDTANLLVSILGLGLVPVLAYLLWAIVPGLRRKGRKTQRSLAFLFSLIGYIGTFLYGHIHGVPEKLLLILDSYLASLLLLSFINYVIRIKASGHACSVAGPLVLFVYFAGWVSLIPCLAIEVLSCWASHRTKRHTLSQLLLGTAAALCAFGIAWLLHHLFGEL